jgi:DNA adenine methylase
VGDLERAARLIYLVALSFNGIHRVNLKGAFNVPYGKKYHLKPCDPDRIHAISRALSSTTLVCSDFERVVCSAQRGDFIYFDPPYPVAHANNGFVKYNARIFSWEDQIRLARLAKDLQTRGCFVMVSNADHESIHDLYRDFNRVDILRPSVVAASSGHRQRIRECVFLSERSDRC